MIAGFADVSLLQIALVAGVALCASVVGGVAGYGTGALMPLVLVPMIGPEPVVPIIAISALLTNSGRVSALRGYIDWRRTAIVLAGAIPTSMLSAYGYTLLTGKGVLIVIGGMLMLAVPLRRMLKRRAYVLDGRGLAFGAAIYGLLAGGTVGAGVILISLLMASGLTGAAVVASDAAIAIAVSLGRLLVFGLAGAVDAKVIAFAVLIGGVAFPGAFLARALIERMPVQVHTAILDGVVLTGGAVMIYHAIMR